MLYFEHAYPVAGNNNEDFRQTMLFSCQTQCLSKRILLASNLFPSKAMGKWRSDRIGGLLGGRSGLSGDRALGG